MRRAFLAIVLALSAASAGSYTAAELLRTGTIHDVAISPGGRFIAVGIGNQVGITEAIAILDVQREATERLVRRIPLATDKGQRIVTQLAWASDAYLLAFMNHVSKEPVSDPALKAVLHTIHVGGDAAIKPYDALPRPVRVIEDARPDSRFVYLTAGPVIRGFVGPRAYEVELATGSARLLAEPDTLTLGWRVRDGRAVVKFNQGDSGEAANIFASLSEGDDWKRISTLRYPEDKRNHLEVIAEAESPIEDYLRKTRSGADVDGIHRRDLRTLQIVETVIELPGRDILTAQFRQRKFVSATYLDDSLQLQFEDADMQRHYAGLQKYFGADTSVRVTPSSTLSGAWLLHVSGPRNPGEYHFYDPERRHVELIGAERPWLDAEQLAPSTALSVAARDGTALRAYVTCPADAGEEPRPLVVIAPSGPWAHAYLRYNAYAQAFAAQGWCVVEPNIRGTYGRGRAFQMRAFGQWNGLVADDLADTIQALVKNGSVDAARVVGFGDFLGATALMAAEVRQPGMLKAMVAYAPVVDAEHLLLDQKNRSGRGSLAYEDWSLWLGALGESSVLRKQLMQIRTPMYLIHPAIAGDVPADDTRALAKALVKAGHDPQVKFPGFSDTVPSSPQLAEQLESVVGFLREHLGTNQAIAAGVTQ